ncbi:Trypanosomal VSG domain containing protein, putative [Trypanosoma equiperdum]|uniref:Trypanosomal VSG domain containing protein, putative n=1 Tax=Trypanosoma equiperdum TaxID=5694 RepID=A0A1G4HYC3_TRYEQ|nr:Trypanosomal VSG domain containing protein, putative [Trypanosoma equiperdum]
MKRLTAVVLLVLWSHGRLQKSNAEPNAQAAEFNALCSILELANKGLTIGGVTTPPSIQTDIKFLTALNLSLAADDFFNQNFKRTDSPKGESEEWTENKATWAELQENIKAGNKGSLDTIIHRIEGEQRRIAARQVVNATLHKVASLKKALKSTPSSEDIKEAMQLVLYGDKEATRHRAKNIRLNCRERPEGVRPRRLSRPGSRYFASQRLRLFVRCSGQQRDQSLRRVRRIGNNNAHGLTDSNKRIHRHSKVLPRIREQTNTGSHTGSNT